MFYERNTSLTRRVELFVLRTEATKGKKYWWRTINDTQDQSTRIREVLAGKDLAGELNIHVG